MEGTEIRPRLNVTDNVYFAQSGRPTMDFLVQAKDYIERVANTTGRSAARVLDDVVRSVFSYKNVEFKKDHRYWLYKNSPQHRRALTSEEIALRNDLTDFARSPEQPQPPAEEASKPKQFSIRDGCPVHRKDCRTWKHKSNSKQALVGEIVCEWYKKFSRWRSALKGKKLKFSPKDDAMKMKEEAIVEELSPAEDEMVYSEPPQVEDTYTDVIGVPLNKKSAAYCVGLQSEHLASETDSDKTSDKVNNGDLTENSSSGSETALQEIQEADEILAMKIYEAELNNNADLSRDANQDRVTLPCYRPSSPNSDGSNSPPTIEIQEITEEDTAWP